MPNSALRNPSASPVPTRIAMCSGDSVALLSRRDSGLGRRYLPLKVFDNSRQRQDQRLTFVRTAFELQVLPLKGAGADGQAERNADQVGVIEFDPGRLQAVVEKDF